MSLNILDTHFNLSWCDTGLTPKVTKLTVATTTLNLQISSLLAIAIIEDQVGSIYSLREVETVPTLTYGGHR